MLCAPMRTKRIWMINSIWRFVGFSVELLLVVCVGQRILNRWIYLEKYVVRIMTISVETKEM